QASPSFAISRLSVDGHWGEQIDFENARRARGGRVSVAASFRPTDHLELRWNSDLQWLDEEGYRLLTAQVERLKATYNFSSRAFLRLIGQWVEVRRNPALYTYSVPEREGGLSASVLVAYKLNWQSVLFLGYGDNRAIAEN